MTRIGKLRGSLFLAIVLAAGLTATLLATRSGNASGATSRQVVKVVRNPALGKRILVTRSGITFYSLSGEAASSARRRSASPSGSRSPSRPA